MDNTINVSPCVEQVCYQRDIDKRVGIHAKTPRGRPIRIGSAWQHTSRAGNEYLSLLITLGTEKIRVNAVDHDDAPEGFKTLIPLKE